VDIVGATGAPSAFWYTDGVDVFFRIRVSESPWDIEGSTLRDNGWGIALNADASLDASTIEFVVGVREASATVAAYENTTGASGAEASLTSVHNFDATGLIAGGGAGVTVRIVEADTNINTGQDYFVDYQVPLNDFLSNLGLTESDTFQMAIMTGQDGLEAMDADFASGGGFQQSWTDDIGIDRDGDGVTDTDEAIHGTDPLDADTDDDGLDDGRELLINTEPLECDTDSDGLPDGLERGVTTPDADTDTAAGCFVADTDPGSKTNANDQDHDDGGVADGDEDWNTNGAVDTWEIDPLVGADDVDTDGDGVWDVLEDLCDLDDGNVDDADSDGDGIDDADEWLWDSDGDGWADFCDEDSDNDGIPDAEEGDGDTDGDGDEDYRDTDSDNDGVPDEEEGTGDDDGDGLPNYQDDDDTDGPDGDRDGDGLSNGEEDECGSDPDNPDTDGDGIPDGDEGPCDEDSDCDGIPNWDDPTDDDLCPDDSGGDDTGLAGDPAFQGGHFTGGSCSSVPGGGSWLFALGGLALLIGRRRRKWAAPMAAAGLASVALIPATANAQSAAQALNAQRFTPAPDGQHYWVLRDTAIGAPFKPGGALVFNYANDPFVYRYDDGRDELKLLEQVGTVDAQMWMNLPRARVALTLPLHVVSTGYGVDGFRAIGDARLSAQGELIERRGDGAGAGVYGWMDVPSGNEGAWLGEAGVTGGAGLAGSYGMGPLLFAGNLGASSGTGQQFLDDIVWGPRLDYAGGVGFTINPALQLSAELNGEWIWGQEGAPGRLPLELLGGVRFRPMDNLQVSVGGGTGLSQGIGSPDYRVMAGVAWSPRPAQAAPGINDMDGDGIADEVDLCPTQPEDFNGVDDDDGCPDGDQTPTRLRVLDASGNQVAGAVVDFKSGPDTASFTLQDGELMRSMEPGAYTGTVRAAGYTSADFELEVPTARSHEQTVRISKELADGRVVINAQDEAGMPVAARVRVLGDVPLRLPPSQDGVTELSLAPGSYELVLSAEGYGTVQRALTVTEGGSHSLDVVLPSARVKVETDRILILDKVYFELDSAQIKAESLPLLDEVVEVMFNHPELVRVEIQGHTDEQGPDDYNLDLSMRRAESVKHYLVSQGVEPSRLAAQGYGESVPLVQESNDEAYAVNRRVEFHIVERAE
jgi:MYXO-CTERM domain-containing protein